jgi:cobalt/nickel transport system permease protein
LNKASKAWSELQAMDELAAGNSLIHRLHPLVKLLVTIAYIAVVVSYSKYELSGLVIVILYPVFMFQVSLIPVHTCFYKLRYILPLVMAVGIVNPFLDTTPMLYLGGVTISGGVISMLTLMLKGIFSLMASFILIATTTIDALCAALRKLHVPELIVTLLLLTYRYISVMIEQVSVMTDAYHLRAPKQKGIQFSAWGSFLGQLMLRSMDRAQELYQSMRLRGFHGEFYYAKVKHFTGSDAVFGILCLAFFLLSRYVDISRLLGNFFM